MQSCRISSMTLEAALLQRLEQDTVSSEPLFMTASESIHHLMVLQS